MFHKSVSQLPTISPPSDGYLEEQRDPPAPLRKKVYVEADIPASQLDEFNHAVSALVAGERPPMDALARAMKARSSAVP